MQQTKLIEALRSLEPKEWKRFEAYVNSPFINKNPRTRKLLQILSSYAPNLDDPKLSKQQIFKKLFPKEAYKEEKLRYETFGLYSLLKDYFAYQELDADPLIKEFYTLSQLRKRNVQGPFDTHMKAIAKQMRTKGPALEGFHYKKYLLADEANAFFYMNQQVRSFNESLQEKIDELNANFIVSKLRFACEELNRIGPNESSPTFYLIAEIMTFLNEPENAYQGILDIRLWAKLYRMLRHSDNTKLYDPFMIFWRNEEEAFEQKDRKVVYEILQNYCENQLDKGNTDFNVKLFTLHQDIVDKDLLLTKGKIGKALFLRIIEVAVLQEAVSFARNFLGSQNGFLDAEIHKDTLCLADAICLHAEESYHLAIEKLEKHPFKELSLAISGRYLILAIMVEEKDWHTAEFHVDTFLIFTKRAKFPKASISNAHVKFLNNLKKYIIHQGNTPLPPSEWDKHLVKHNVGFRYIKRILGSN